MKTETTIKLLQRALQLKNSTLEWAELLKTATEAIRKKDTMYYAFELHDHITVREKAKEIIKSNETEYKLIIQKLYGKD
jgi:inactivated superfamily I helicase